MLGRFLPEFGRVVAQMEHSLYHVYTVDEHTIRAIGMLHQIETGQLADELPLATGLMPKVLSRTELYVAVLFHDLGKGRGGDHSEIGARMVQRDRAAARPQRRADRDRRLAGAPPPPAQPGRLQARHRGPEDGQRRGRGRSSRPSGCGCCWC